MSKLLRNLSKEKVINPPKWLIDNVMYMCQMGSVAYGAQQDDSDADVYGFAVPPKHMLYQPLNQRIPGFDKDNLGFEQWTEHHCISKEYKKEYDFSIYNITKYFNLVMQNNPNMIDSLFVPRNCIIHSSPMFEKIREKRHMFLHRGAYHKFKGYAYSQLHKMNIKVPQPGSKREGDYEKYGYSTKFAYHIVRLLNEAEQILLEGDLDLQRNNEQLKSISRGEWTADQIQRYFDYKEGDLEKAYNKSSLPYKPDVDAIRALLFECLEMHYDLSDSVVSDSKAENKLLRIQSILNEG